MSSCPLSQGSYISLYLDTRFHGIILLAFIEIFVLFEWVFITPFSTCISYIVVPVHIFMLPGSQYSRKPLLPLFYGLRYDPNGD